ncbi:hypothetical protein GCM10010129_02840 [Streptomyces fumigatiscleroticus]|nr:hypothetical protein GCM10010129_02840 [Streptomyces fumigatiscleroticus]
MKAAAPENPGSGDEEPAGIATYATGDGEAEHGGGRQQQREHEEAGGEGRGTAPPPGLRPSPPVRAGADGGGARRRPGRREARAGRGRATGHMYGFLGWARDGAPTSPQRTHPIPLGKANLTSAKVSRATGGATWNDPVTAPPATHPSGTAPDSQEPRE